MSNDDLRWLAVEQRDAGADGAFVYGVRSTGIYCRPSCPSRRPRRRHVRFFDGPPAAEAAGFRACRRCHPHRRVDPALDRIRRACDFIAAHAHEQPALAAVAAHVGLSPFHLQRTFKRVVGVSPRALAAQCRLDGFRTGVRSGRSVTAALYDAGYGSSSRLYEQARTRLGMTPGAYRSGGAAATIRYCVSRSSLGHVLVATTDAGLCAVFLGGSPAMLAGRLRKEFPKAVLTADDRGLASLIDPILRYLAGRGTHVDLPLDVQATAFQRRVWDELSRIPYGETRTYGDVARAIGRPTAARAVARACAANPASVVIPCHRVVPRQGGTGGYRWGRARKEALLALENPEP